MIMTKTGIEFIRPEIADMHEEWTVIHDCLIGEPAIKAKGGKYLPYPSTSECKDEDKSKYDKYLERANFLNVTRRTIYELLAKVFVKPPIVTTAKDVLMETILRNASGDGVSLEQCAKNSLKHCLAYAYGGVWVNCPVVPANLSKADYAKGQYRPRIINFSPFQIRNFRVENFGLEDKLTLVVLGDQSYAYDSNGFETKLIDVMHVLKLVNDEYVYEEYRREGGYTAVGIPTGSYKKTKTVKPTNSAGEPLNYIPFFFFGMENNNPYPDNPMMYDLASLNIAHYRNSADYEQTMFIAGQPTLILSGLNAQTPLDVEGEGGLKLGADRAILLKNGGTSTLLQAKPDSGLAEAMSKKEKQMAAFGAKFLETKEVAKTAYQVKVEDPSQSTILGSCATNVADAYQKALVACHELCGLDIAEVHFELNTDFEFNRVGSEELVTATNCWINGGITYTEYRAVLRRAKLATEDDNDAKREYEEKQQRALSNTQNNNQDEKGAKDETETQN